MREREYLWCILNLMLDDETELAQLCPSCRSAAEEERCPACGCDVGMTEENTNFDLKRFEELGRGGGL